jgi:hypothetical protein
MTAALVFSNTFIPINDLPELPTELGPGMFLAVQAGGTTYKVDARKFPLGADALLTWVGMQATLPFSRVLAAGAGITLTPNATELVITSTISSGVNSVNGGAGIDVDNTDPANPIISLNPAALAGIGLALTAVQPGDLSPVAFTGNFADLTGVPPFMLSVVGTANQINVDATDPVNPILSLAPAVLSALGAAGSAVQAVIGTVNQVDVDATNPINPVVSLAASVLASIAAASTAVQIIVGTANEITVDATIPQAPIVALAASVLASLALANTAVQPGALAPVATAGTLVSLTDVNIVAPGAGQQGYAVTWDNPSAKFVLSAGGGGGLLGITAGFGILVDNTNPSIPVVSVNQAANYHWTGIHTFDHADASIGTGFKAGVSISDPNSFFMILTNPNGGPDEKSWLLNTNHVTNVLTLQSVNDAFTDGRAVLAVTRVPNSMLIESIAYGNSDRPPHSVSGAMYWDNAASSPRGVAAGAPASAQYYLIATLPQSHGGSFDHIVIEGVFNNTWGSGGNSAFKFVCGNRNGFTASYELLHGAFQGASGIACFQEADLTTSIYYYESAGTFTAATFRVTTALGTNGLVHTDKNPFITAPTGTLLYSTGNTQPRLAMQGDGSVVAQGLVYGQSGFRTESQQYAAIRIVGTGIDTNWCGIQPSAASGCLMIGSDGGAGPNQFGFYSPANGWMWRWDTGTLGAGTVPAARLSGVGNAIYYNVDSNATASTVVLRDVSGYIWNYYINTSSPNSENPPISQVMVTNGTDGFMRKADVSHLAAYLGVASYQSAFAGASAGGYMIFTNGFKIMWGTYTQLGNNYTYTYYPTAFVSWAIAMLCCTPPISATAQDNPPGPVEQSITYFRSYSSIDNNSTAWYIAVGY